MEDFDHLWHDHEMVHTTTSEEQGECERECSMFLRPIHQYSRKVLKRLKEDIHLINEDNELCLMREAHTAFLAGGLEGLRGGFVSLDSSKPWILYWITHALHLLHADPHHLSSRIVSTLSHMQHGPNAPVTSSFHSLEGIKGIGGYSGGPNQIPHCAPTFAAILALCTVGTKEALNSIDRSSIYRFFHHFNYE